MPRDNFKSFDLLAIHAGRKAGLKMPPAAEAAGLPAEKLAELTRQVADDRKACALRDKLYVDYERRLRDSAYSGDQVWQWFAKTYGPIGRTSIYRARAALRANESRIAETAAQAQAFVDLAEAEGADGVFAGATQRAGQLIFQLLYQLRSEDLDTDDPAKIAKILNALGSLQKARVETQLIKAKCDELRRKFDRQIAAAKGKTRDGKLTDEMIDQVRKAVFGSV